MRAIFVAMVFAACAALAAHAECRGSVVRLEVARDGAVSWNGEVFKTPQQMIDRFRREASSPQQPKILFLPSREVAIPTAYAVLAEAQKAGLDCLAFSGFDQKRSADRVN